MSSGSYNVWDKFMTPFGEALWYVRLSLDSGTYTARVSALGDSYKKWGGDFFDSTLYLNESRLRSWYGDEWVRHEIPDEKWAPAQPENETSRNYLLAQKEEPMDGYSSMWQSVGIAAATGFSLALCIYTSKRVKANRTDSD